MLIFFSSLPITSIIIYLSVTDLFFCISKMINPTQNFNINQLFLLFSIVSYCHSLVIMSSRFLSHELTILATLVSLTCNFIITLYCLKMNKAYPTTYWHYFLLMSAYLSTSNSSNWNFRTGSGCLLVGFTFLSSYLVYFQCRKWWGSSQGQEEQTPRHHRLPLLVDGAFVFMCNGAAIMARWFMPCEKLAWIFTTGAIMFLLSAVFFHCYFKYSTTT